jgi:hypothetical protein
MNLEEEIGKLTQMLRSLCADAESAMSAGDPEAARRIGEALAQVRQHEAPFVAGLRSMHAEALDKMAQAQKGAEDSQKELDRLHQEYEKAKAARARPVAPPRPKPDPGKADRVNSELLRRFGQKSGAPPAPAAAADPGSLWRQLDGEVKREPEPLHAAPPPPPADKPKTAPPRAPVTPPDNHDASLWPFMDELEPPEKQN